MCITQKCIFQEGTFIYNINGINSIQKPFLTRKCNWKFLQKIYFDTLKSVSKSQFSKHLVRRITTTQLDFHFMLLCLNSWLEFAVSLETFEQQPYIDAMTRHTSKSCNERKLNLKTRNKISNTEQKTYNTKQNLNWKREQLVNISKFPRKKNIFCIYKNKMKCIKTSE